MTAIILIECLIWDIVVNDFDISSQSISLVPALTSNLPNHQSTISICATVYVALFLFSVSDSLILAAEFSFIKFLINTPLKWIINL